jgi:hypothetical protein
MSIEEISNFLASKNLTELVSGFKTIRLDQSCSVTIETLPALAFISVLLMMWLRFRQSAQSELPGTSQGPSESPTKFGPELQQPAEDPVQEDPEAPECEEYDSDGPIFRCECLNK